MVINNYIKDSVSTGNAGLDLSESGALLELETLTRPTPAVNSDGKRISDDVDEHEPDWNAVESRCVELLKNSRDLRVAVFYGAALLRTQGFPGLVQGLWLIKKLLGEASYQAFPTLQTAESTLERWYTIVALSVPYKRDGDLLRIVEGLRTLPLVKTNLVSFCYKDVLAAKYKSGGADVGALERMKNDWRNLSSEDRSEIAISLESALALAGEIEGLLVEQVPGSVAPSGDGRPLQLLMQELRGMVDFTAFSPVVKREEKQDVPKQKGKTEVKTSMQDGINSRADAVRALHEVAEFFRKTEPASPVPYFVERAARLVDRDFLGLLDELAPDALPAFQSLAGVSKERTD